MAWAQIAVIIPTYNRASLLPVALESVIAQTTDQRIEAIVVDDGSTDNTGQVMGPYLERYGEAAEKVRIRYKRLERQGVVTARNVGIAETEGQWVAFLDSDDYWAPTKLQKQLAVAEPDPGAPAGPALESGTLSGLPGLPGGAGVVHTSFRYVDEQGQVRDEGPQRVDNPCVGRCVDVLLNEDLVLFSSVLMKRSVIEAAAKEEKHGLPFDPRWTNAQDYDLLLRAARLCAFAYVPEALTLYRLHGAHGAMGNLKKAYGFHCRVQIDFVQRYGKEIGIDEAEARRRAGGFLLGRAEAAFWRREMETAKQLCELARELGVGDERFGGLERRLGRPAWVYALKDRLDRMMGRG